LAMMIPSVNPVKISGCFRIHTKRATQKDKNN
jgi:hypothetical protein